jgi:hypothetical protein
MQHFVLDGIGPFFRDLPPGRINWSKIPFAAIEEDGRLPAARVERLVADFDTVCARAAGWGFTTITLDDVAHLSDSPHYPAELKVKLSDYRALYRRLIDVARGHGLSVWFTTDILFYTPVLLKAVGENLDRATAFLAGVLAEVFTQWPEIGGIVFRIGESDGHDVEGDFLSRLIVRTPRQGRRFVQALLPLFERHGRLLVFRTWSVGAYRIGDLIWNRETYDALFGGLTSPALIVSMKYGESDFFRYLRLNPQFFKAGPATLVEFQARREYEGFGEYPAFIGRDTAGYRDALREAPNLVGMSVWGQTGGWSSYRRLTFLDPESIWNEINVWTCLRLFRDQVSVEGAVRSYALRQRPDLRWDRLLELLDLSESVIKELLYNEEFAARRIYFRRLRIPPLLAVYWDRLFINGALRKIHRCFVLDGELAIRRGFAALAKLDRMEELAVELGLPVDDLRFQRDTYRLLALARVFYFRPVDEACMATLEQAVRDYRATWGARGYTVGYDLAPWKVGRRKLKRLLAVVVRDRRRYRWVDRLFTLHVLARLYTIFRFTHGRFVPEFARKQAMGIDSIFR